MIHWILLWWYLFEQRKKKKYRKEREREGKKSFVHYALQISWLKIKNCEWFNKDYTFSTNEWKFWINDCSPSEAAHKDHESKMFSWIFQQPLIMDHKIKNNPSKTINWELENELNQIQKSANKILLTLKKFIYICFLI